MAKLKGWQIAQKINERLEDMVRELKEREEFERAMFSSAPLPVMDDDEEDFDSDEWLDGERADPFTNW